MSRGHRPTEKEEQAEQEILAGDGGTKRVRDLEQIGQEPNQETEVVREKPTKKPKNPNTDHGT